MKLHFRALFLVLFLVVAQFVCAQSSAGKEFMMAFMQNSNNVADDELLLHITSQQPTFGEVALASGLWSESFYCAPGLPAVIAVPAADAEVVSNQIIEMKGVHITSEDAVEVVAYNYASSTADAARLIPIEHAGISYVVASYGGSAANASQLLLVGAFDDTEIVITPSVTTANGNLANVPFVVTLDSGECYQVLATGNADLTGTLIVATQQSGNCRPFSVFSGASCANVPASCASACDHLFEQNIPVSQWGTNYIVTPPVFDPDPDFGIAEPRYTYRILALNNGTNVSVDGVASFVLNAGEFQEYNGQSGTHCIAASSPVAVIQYLEGIACGGNGDPSMNILEPTDHLANAASFHISDVGSIEHHFLNLVIPSTALGHIFLDGVALPVNDFQVVTSCNDWMWYGEEINTGAHVLSSGTNHGFTATIYGHAAENSGLSESYATSVGGNLQHLELEIEDVFCTAGAVIIEVPEGYSNPQWLNNADLETVISANDPFVVSDPEGSVLYVLHAASDFSGCVDTFYFQVDSPAPFNLSVAPQNMTLCEHDELLLTTSMSVPSDNYDFYWTSTNVEQITQMNGGALVSPASTAEYTVTAQSPGGCSIAVATTTVVVNESDVAAFYFEDHSLQLCEGGTSHPPLVVEKKIWSDNVNPAISWGDWENIFGGAESVVCGAVSGNSLYFNGTFPREAITQPMDLSAGGHIYFSIKIANGIAPCDNAEPGDNVILAYSVNNGPWTNLLTLNEASFPDFTEVVADIPPGAMNNNVRLRWRQSGSYTTNQDNWVLDEMYVGVNDLSGFDFSWSPAQGVSNTTQAQASITPDESGWYFLEMTSAASACLYTDSIYIELSEPFTLVLSPDTASCDDDGVQLFVEPSEVGNFSYSWMPLTGISGPQTAQPLVDPAVATTYEVTVTSESGCVVTGEVDVLPGVDLQLQITASDSTICEGEIVELEAVASVVSGQLSYVWTGDGTLTNADASVVSATPDSDQQYHCVVTHTTSGCSAEASLDVEVHPSFTLDPTPDAVTACSVESIVVSASPSVAQNYFWNWSPASMVIDPFAQTTEIAGNQNGVLTVTATSDAGCVAIAEIPVNVNAPLTDLGNDIAACEDEPVLLNCGWPANYTILWNTGEVLPEIIVEASGEYDVLVIDPDGCSSRDTILVTIYDYPTLELGADTTLCDGNVYTLVAGDPGLNYAWNTGSTGSSILVSSDGIYRVEVNNEYCFVEDEIAIGFHPLPEQPFDSELTFCFGIDPDGFLLDAGNLGSEYLWLNDSSTLRYVQVIAGGEYAVQVQTAQQCIATFTAWIEEVCPYSVYAPNSFTPDGDGVNDLWFVYGVNITNYHLRLYNRMGELFYESTDIDRPWLGQRRDGDMYVEPGVYDYQITFQVIDADGNPGDTKVLTGFVVLIR
jgi:gliding motility-associated-like protein